MFKREFGIDPSQNINDFGQFCHVICVGDLDNICKNNDIHPFWTLLSYNCKNLHNLVSSACFEVSKHHTK